MTQYIVIIDPIIEEADPPNTLEEEMANNTLEEISGGDVSPNTDDQDRNGSEPCIAGLHPEIMEGGTKAYYSEQEPPALPEEPEVSGVLL